MHLGVGVVGMGCFHVSPSPVAQQPAHPLSLCSPSPPPRLQMLLRPAVTPRLAIRAQSHVGDGSDHPVPASAGTSLFYLYRRRGKKPHNFPKEVRHISSHLSKLIRVFDGLLHYEAGGNTRCLCGLAENAVNMASRIVDSASLNPTTTTPVVGDGEISRDTVHRTLGAYVQIFVQTADAAFNNTVSKGTITSFLGALRGLASVAHILLLAALEGLGHENPKESLSEYAFNCDVKKMHRVYDRRMRELEDGIRNAPTPMQTCKELARILMPTICEGMEATESFVTLMMARRKRTLGKTHSSKEVE